MQVSCLALFVFGLLCLCIGSVGAAPLAYKYGLEHQELLTYRKDAVLEEKARSINVDMNSPRLGPIVERKHAK